MKFLFHIPAVLTMVAMAQKKDYTPPQATYSCPAGYNMLDDTCVRSETANHLTEQIPQTVNVNPDKNCPKGSVLAGKECIKETISARVAVSTSTKVPITSCPPGSNGPNAQGMCDITNTDQEPVLRERAVANRATRVEKAPYTVNVSRQISVPGNPLCPEGSSNDGGQCAVTSSMTEYFVEERAKTLSLPINTPTARSVCPTGTQNVNGGDGCVATLSQQSVEQASNSKDVRVPRLNSNQKSYDLPGTQLLQRDECPKGSQGQADGSCAITLTRSTLEAYAVPVRSQIPYTTSVPQTLRLSRTSLVASYSCPVGSTPAGGNDASMICSVNLPSGTPTSQSRPRTVRIARLEKRPVTVTVNRVESIPVYYCPSGTTERHGQCEVTVTIQAPVTSTDTTQFCPPGSEEYTGNQKATKCKKPVTVSVPATQLPSNLKKGGPRYSCPEGTTPLGEGASMTCVMPSYEEVPYESLTTTSISYESSNVTESVPKLLRYETRTVTEEAATEEVYTVYDEQTLEETTASIETSSYTETVPAIAAYTIATDYEEVTVHNDRVTYAACSDNDSRSYNGMYGNAKENGNNNDQCLVETRHRVVSENYTQTVARVPVYYTESTVETAVADETEQIYDTLQMTETSHSVATHTSEQVVEANQIVQYNTSYEPTTVSELKINSQTVPLTAIVPSLPTYRTETLNEEATSARVTTVSANGGDLFESFIVQETVTLYDQVAPQRSYRTESNVHYECPAGTRDNGDACMSSTTVPAVYRCPSGSTTGKDGNCTQTTYTTRSMCPDGYTDTGKLCERTTTINPIATYSKKRGRHHNSGHH